MQGARCKVEEVKADKWAKAQDDFRNLLWWWCATPDPAAVNFHKLPEFLVERSKNSSAVRPALKRSFQVRLGNYTRWQAPKILDPRLPALQALFPKKTQPSEQRSRTAWLNANTTPFSPSHRPTHATDRLHPKLIPAFIWATALIRTLTQETSFNFVLGSSAAALEQ